MALPQSEDGDQDNVLVKAEGNMVRINISWTLIDETTSPVVPWGTSPTTFISSSKYPNGIKTPDEQVMFFLDEFQNKGVEYLYRITIGDTNTIRRWGNIEKFTAQKQGIAPVTWKANLTFIAGNVVTVG